MSASFSVPSSLTSDTLLTVKRLTANTGGIVIMSYRSGRLGFTGLTAGVVPKSTVLLGEFPVSCQRRLAPLNSALEECKGERRALRDENQTPQDFTA